MPNRERLQGVQVTSIEQAWLNLASDILLLAIEDARQKHDLVKQEKALKWLRSPAAQLLFDSLLPTNTDIELATWIEDGCPLLKPCATL